MVATVEEFRSSSCISMVLMAFLRLARRFVSVCRLRTRVDSEGELPDTWGRSSVGRSREMSRDRNIESFWGGAEVGGSWSIETESVSMSSSESCWLEPSAKEARVSSSSKPPRVEMPPPSVETLVDAWLASEVLCLGALRVVWTSGGLKGRPRRASRTQVSSGARSSSASMYWRSRTSESVSCCLEAMDAQRPEEEFCLKVASQLVHSASVNQDLAASPWISLQRSTRSRRV